MATEISDLTVAEIEHQRDRAMVRLTAAYRLQRLVIVFTAHAAYRCVVSGFDPARGMVVLESRDRRGNWSHATIRTDEVVAVELAPAVKPS